MSNDLDLQSILGEPRNSPKLTALIQRLGSLATPPITSLAPDSKSYAGTTYDNYYDIGISLMFTHPTKGSNVDEYVCDSIDVMNVPDAEAGNTRAAKTSSRYRPFPGLPLPLTKRDSATTATDDTSSSSETFPLKPTTIGAEFVQYFGEPGRKGGGTGSAGPGIWCDWPGQGLMVEFGGDEARGPSAWETGAKAVWSVVTLFRPT
ncbi:hypothetical protein BN14_01057 [Rhizoctonia solani AG-1 IB]|uniref:Uncharacterized protein n=1 Tax=Thanatephorus cucumeris (strain AG1-IB / isolate 7/3/14) TaxID=1108050 RepID=M5BJZ9_THACB|nr:hypothetical protein BN14_01057 [Rhizoctonia solani AG-1 IB]